MLSHMEDSILFYSWVIFHYRRVYIRHYLHSFICPWTLRFRVLASIYNAAMNIGVHVSFQISVFFG